MVRLFLLMAAAILVASVAVQANLHFTVGESEQAFLNELHHPSSLHHARALETIFLELDANSDGQIDPYELNALEHEGRISQTEHILLRAFDTDASGSISQAELTLAPHTLNLLETSIELDPIRLSAEEAAAAAAFEGIDTHDINMQPRRLKSRVAHEQQQETVLSEMGAWSRAIPPAGTPRVKAAAGSRRGTAPLPVSQFGVPSVADEECVLCQYFVQRIQNGVADRLENGPKAAGAQAPTGGEGLPGATAAAQQALKVRNTNSQLQKKPGGRGVVRVVAEDLLQALCAVDKMPLLFTPYCSGFTEPNAINAIRKGIFFNIPTVEVCQQAALCRDDSYINTNAAVHATKTSLFLNGQRGICGMLGGSRDRPNSREGQLLNAICSAHGAVFGQQ